MLFSSNKSSNYTQNKHRINTHPLLPNPISNMKQFGQIHMYK